MTTKTTGRARAAGAALLLGVLLAGCGLPAAGQPPAPAAPPAPAVQTGTAAPPPVTVRPTAAAVSYPADGGNRWYGAAGETPAPGGTGRLRRYRVAVERDIRGIPVAEFAGEVTRTLNDPRGWTAGGALRLRRVGWGQPADFTIYLVTPGTRDELCGDVPDGYTSCRNGGRVVLNVARWVKGVPRYGASLASYRQYMVNHEVGHRLGMGHERCPGRGRPAPVMQQQTLGLHGCTANAWPYLDGKRYTGPSGAYDDAIPLRERGRTG
ncbi:DUF3152 domain-containing protein [Micromonospora sp. C28SCA-DRY-2]|uniref:DUF3152 domain-containing protein n=1 Tax=Micromonospora sp. C28SCA-DRY-2 TaxID=3059522 RepID=UPI0026754310|nr:DUF3152 domain-containing protein [Micromonospora sp. C28SCA-DRY-2]MDO3703601.1 DUF3152 domain-containing protein [Micromonospora sp. C28SCA-DRY-2]